MQVASQNTPGRKRLLWSEFLLVTLLICFSGNPAFVSVGILSKVGGVILAALTVFVFYKRITKPDWIRVLKWCAFVTFIFAAQVVTLHYVSPMACLNFLSKLVSAILIPAVMGRKFRVIYLKIMTVVGAISLVFFA